MSPSARLPLLPQLVKCVRQQPTGEIAPLARPRTAITARSHQSESNTQIVQPQRATNQKSESQKATSSRSITGLLLDAGLAVKCGARRKSLAAVSDQLALPRTPA